MMLYQNVNKVVALNKDGEHSTLIQKPINFKYLPFKYLPLPQAYQKILIEGKKQRMGMFAASEYGKMYARLFPKKLQKKAEGMVHSHIGPRYGDRNKIDAFRKNLLSLSFEDCMEIESIMDSLKENGTFTKVLNDFWERISKKINCVYETNFSSLKKQ